MRKTLFSVLPLVVLFVPVLSRMPFFQGAFPPVSDEQAVTAAALLPEQLAQNKYHARLAAARRLLEAAPAESTDFVTLAVEDVATAQIHLLRLAKDVFLNKDVESVVSSSLGESLRLQVVRPNYVNTAVRVLNAAGRELQPLLVQYPVEKNGSLKEVAYYSSAHPALHSPEMVRAGGNYIHESLNEAARRLEARGKKISPDVVDVAERLCVVEHTDHKRFKTEDHASLYEEIFTLYALNSGDTYRYSVSSAGAGGMVQMIPPTYQMVRDRHPYAGLNPDFVSGMRDHGNALEAMLLYMQDTWDDLLKKEQVRQALASKIATQPELLAAGYNSNPARLAKYLERGGSGWRTLIPGETQMYLRIYASVEGLVKFKPRA